MKTYETGPGGYPLDPELRRLEIHLSDLAATFRGARGMPEQQEQIIQEYHTALAQLYALGWDDALDIDSELPDGLMPEEYIRRTAQLREEALRRFRERQRKE